MGGGTSWAAAAVDTESPWSSSTADIGLLAIAHIKNSGDLVLRVERWGQSLEKWSSLGDTAPKDNTECRLRLGETSLVPETQRLLIP